MKAFTTLTGVAAPMDLINIDTDMIIPKQFLKTIKRSGLGRNLFHEMRFDDHGNEIKDFILNREPWRQAEILVAGDNFGCGSSREHAPWALLDFGIRCVIAPSFADIFFNNTYKNGILPVILAKAAIDELTKQLQDGGHNARITIDLAKQIVIGPQGQTYHFEIDAHRKHCLLNGLDDIGQTMQKQSSIASFENSRPAWLNPQTI